MKSIEAAARELSKAHRSHDSFAVIFGLLEQLSQVVEAADEAAIELKLGTWVRYPYYRNVGYPAQIVDTSAMGHVQIHIRNESQLPIAHWVHESELKPMPGDNEPYSKGEVVYYEGTLYQIVEIDRDIPQLYLVCPPRILRDDMRPTWAPVRDVSRTL
jgi:hypothetical protein